MKRSKSETMTITITDYSHDTRRFDHPNSKLFSIDFILNKNRKERRKRCRCCLEFECFQRDDHIYNTQYEKCKVENCKMRPIMNFPGKVYGVFCKSHADPKMIQIIFHKCLVSGCNYLPRYGYPENNEKIFCHVHAESDMIKIKKIKSDKIILN